MVGAALLVAGISVSMSVSAQDSRLSEVESLLEETLAVKASDSYLRMNLLEAQLEQSPEIAEQCEILKEMIYLSIDSGDQERLTRYGALGQGLAAKAQDNELKIYSDLAYAVIDHVNGDLDNATSKISQVRIFAQSVGDENGLFLIDAVDAIVGMDSGNYLTGLTKLTSSTLTLPDTLRGNWMRMLAYLTLAYTYTGIGDVDHITSYYLQALELSRNKGVALDRESILYNVATALQNTRQYDLAERYYQGILEVAGQNENPGAPYYAHEGLAWLMYLREDYDGALAYAELALASPTSDPVTKAHLLDLTALSHAQLGDPHAARAFLQQSQDLFAETQFYDDTSNIALLTRSFILRAEGKADEAFDLLNRARRQQINDRANNFNNTVSYFHDSLDSLLERQRAELELSRVQSTNTNLILIFSVLFIAMLAGALAMQRRHNKALVQSRVQAEQASKAKSDFLANMSHELRTPLNAILGFSEIMTHKIFGELGARQYDDYANHINQSGKHLLDIINDILDLSKVESGQLQLSDEFLDLSVLISDTCALVENRARENNIVIKKDIPEHSRYLLADRRLTKQILLNLLSNAVKFTDQGGLVSVGTERAQGGGLIITVKDNGVGMSDHELSLALTPFGQAGTTLTRSHEGTGLGLPLASTLMELHDGALMVVSEKHVGTTVKMCFPSERHIVGPDERLADAAARKESRDTDTSKGKKSSEVPTDSENHAA